MINFTKEQCVHENSSVLQEWCSVSMNLSVADHTRSAKFERIESALALEYE